MGILWAHTGAIGCIGLMWLCPGIKYTLCNRLSMQMNKLVLVPWQVYTCKARSVKRT